MIYFIFIFVLQLKDISSLQSFTTEPSYTEVNPGSDTILTCIVDNIGGECRWQKDGKPVGLFEKKYDWAAHSTTGDCSISIYKASIKFDDGLWECQVTSSSFESQDALASKSARLVIREPPRTLSLLRNKNSVTPGSQITVIDSKMESIHCESRHSNPAPKILWFLGDENISDFSVQNNETEPGDLRRWKALSVLEYSFQKKDVGRHLRCQVVHPAMALGSMENSVQLDVLYKPNVKIIKSFGNDIIEEGKTSVSLLCESEANPPARVFWKKLGSHSDPSHIEKLEFDPVLRKDTGTYICQGENSIGISEEAATELDVLYSPKIIGISPTGSLTVGVHNRSILTCSAEGNPLPKYQWLQKLPNNQVLKRGFEDKLVIEDTTYDHQGDYVCEAISLIGNDRKIAQSQAIKVEVQGAPQVLRYSVAKEIEAISGRDVQLEMEVCSDPMPSRTTWDWGALRVEAGKNLHERYMAEEISVHPEREDCYIAKLIVKSVNPNDSRRYFLDVENIHGTDRYAVSLTVKDPVSLASVIGVVVSLLIVFVILVIIMLYAYKSQRLCFKDTSKLDMKEQQKTKKQSRDVEKAKFVDSSLPPDEMYKNERSSVDKTWPENSNYTSYYTCGSGDCLSSTSAAVESVNRMLYAELQFPVTSNYGSMKKKSQRIRATLETRGSEETQRGLGTSSSASSAHTDLSNTLPSTENDSPSSKQRYVPEYIQINHRKTAV